MILSAQRNAEEKPFGFGRGPIGRLPGVLGLLEGVAGHVLAFDALNIHYAKVTEGGERGAFAQRVLENFNIQVELADEQLKRVPSKGPLVVVANHPFGALDGLALMSVIKRVRPDVKLMVNYFLELVPELREDCFFVDPFGGPEAVRRNIASMRGAIRWVREGGALCVFPAGEVSRLEVTQGAVVDAPWSTTVGRLIRQTGAQVSPVYFEGSNRAVFQLAGLVHPRLRTALLPREMLARQGVSIKMAVGSPVPVSRVKGMKDEEELVQYLRARVHILRRTAAAEPAAGGGTPSAEPVASMTADPDGLAREVNQLGADRLLMEAGPMRVVWAFAKEIPLAMREIGRLRELAFRAVGEGTGKALDLDRFDDHYRHLFLWNDAKKEIVGAYRLAMTGETIKAHGVDGLYTRTLFRFERKLIDEMGPGIELGRSFVRPEYQKEFSPLALLWSGVFRFVAKHPEHKMAFGPVSISNDYSSLSKHLLMAFLKMNSHLPDLARHVQPRNPVKPMPARKWDASVRTCVAASLNDVDEMVREIEADGRGVPVLVRQYLKLNARLLGFNVDPAFGDALDALVVVDLSQVDETTLGRYMGRELAEEFLRFHGRGK